MKLRHLPAIAAPLAALALVAWPTVAHADGYVAEAHRTGPNRSMIGSGIVTLGVSYGVSVIVASQSDHEGDQNLYIPVAGPWMDLTTRGGCSVQPCGHETGNKVLLVADGIIQALGALDIVAGLFTQESVVTAKTKPAETNVAQVTWHVAPSIAGRSYGLAAVGTF